MVENFNTIESLIKRYLIELKENNIPIERAFLYGSYARGTATEHSDIDFAVISDKFIGDRIEDSLQIAPFIWDIDVRLEPMPYRPEDFKRPDPLVNDILNYGIGIII